MAVRVTAKDRPDISLYFSKKSGLLLKSERRTTEPFSDNEINQEAYYQDYKAVDGIPTPGKLVIHYDGKLFMELELNEVRNLERIDDAMFKQP